MIKPHRIEPAKTESATLDGMSQHYLISSKRKDTSLSVECLRNPALQASHPPSPYPSERGKGETLWCTVVDLQICEEKGNRKEWQGGYQHPGFRNVCLFVFLTASILWILLPG
jgi:hypothetical protein